VPNAPALATRGHSLVVSLGLATQISRLLVGAACRLQPQAVCSSPITAYLRDHTPVSLLIAPADGSPGMTDGGSGHAAASNQCPTGAASEASGHTAMTRSQSQPRTKSLTSDGFGGRLRLIARTVARRVHRLLARHSIGRARDARRISASRQSLRNFGGAGKRRINLGPLTMPTARLL
jgi:hypothetical protein